MLILQRAKAAVIQGDGLLKVDLELTRPVRVGAGQHIWLRVPSASHTSFAESHPFAITSWGNIQNGKAKQITLLVDIRGGFTRELKELAEWESKFVELLGEYVGERYGTETIDRGRRNIKISDTAKITERDLTEIMRLIKVNSIKSKDLKAYIGSLSEQETKAKDLQSMLIRKLQEPVELDPIEYQGFNAYIDGPYGLSPKAEEYGTVILYATGIGIGAQLATVKHLLESREAGTAKTQRVTLLWEVEDDFMEYDQVSEKYTTKYDTAYQMVLDLLQQDFARLSKLRLEPAKEFEYRSGWQGAPPDQGYVSSNFFH
jgi:NAD(P)H-flavin reductase